MRRVYLALLFASSVFATGAADAGEYVIYAHGWTFQGRDLSSCNGQTSCSYWKNQAYSGNVRHIGWNTGADWRTQGVSQAVTTLNNYCRKDRGDYCRIICHSTGCPIVGKTLDLYGKSFNVTRVLTVGSAEGGSELGSLGNFVASILATAVAETFTFGGANLNIIPAPSCLNITPENVRNAYDHNDTAGTPFLHVAGYNGSFGASAQLPGQDDGVVAFHSACGYNRVFGATQCSNDWYWASKCSWGVCVPVMRTAGQWTNHKRVEYCGRDGCNKTHAGVMAAEFQNLLDRAVP